MTTVTASPVPGAIKRSEVLRIARPERAAATRDFWSGALVVASGIAIFASSLWLLLSVI